MAPLIDGQDGAEIALIGLGVIGGSAALRLHGRGTALRAFSSSAADRAAASAAGIDVAASLDEAVNGVGVVLIAINHGAALLSGEFTRGRLTQMLLTLLVSYVV